MQVYRQTCYDNTVWIVRGSIKPPSAIMQGPWGDWHPLWWSTAAKPLNGTT